MIKVETCVKIKSYYQDYLVANEISFIKVSSHESQFHTLSHQKDLISHSILLKKTNLISHFITQILLLSAHECYQYLLSFIYNYIHNITLK